VKENDVAAGTPGQPIASADAGDRAPRLLKGRLPKVLPDAAVLGSHGNSLLRVCANNAAHYSINATGDIDRAKIQSIQRVA
jgi:hypothetical protein